MAADRRRTLQQTLDLAAWRLAAGSMRRLAATLRGGRWPDGPPLTSDERRDMERALEDVRAAVCDFPLGE